MAMLRDFVYEQDFKLVNDALNQFRIERYTTSALVRFEVISPDSFIWRLLLGKHLYYLYAEDYVPGLSHIQKLFDTYVGKNKWELVKVKRPQAFDAAAPVVNATIYKEPDDAEVMMQYALSAGIDFAFLARSHEDADWALFADHAKRGFIMKY